MFGGPTLAYGSKKTLKHISGVLFLPGAAYVLDDADLNHDFQEGEKKKLAQKEAEEERRKKHVKEEYQREKVTNQRYMQVDFAVVSCWCMVHFPLPGHNCSLGNN